MTARRPRLAADRRGATIVEFAIIAPVMMLLIMGLCDICYQGYVQAVLTGALQKAGRDSTIQGNDAAAATTAIDGKVMTAVRSIARAASYTSSRKSYSKFGDVAPERFDDNNNNNSYDAASECFYDINGNGIWDADPGATGQGGASDVVVYSITVTYPRLFPLAGLAGWPNTQSVSSTTILKNQPYKLQASGSATVKICP